MARATGFTPAEKSFLAVMKSANGQKTADELAEVINRVSGAVGDAAIDGQYVRTKYSGIVSNWRKSSGNSGAFPIPGPKGTSKGRAGRSSTRQSFDAAFADLGVVVDNDSDDESDDES